MKNKIELMMERIDAKIRNKAQNMVILRNPPIYQRAYKNVRVIIWGDTNNIVRGIDENLGV